MTTHGNLREKLIVALDFASVSEAEALVRTLGEAVGFYKIGMELAYAGGLPLAEKLINEGKKIFLDLKLHDIPNTVTRATAQIAKLGASFLTIHAYPQTMAAARLGTYSAHLKLLAVTVMTSFDDSDLNEAGYSFGVKDLVARRAAQAKSLGMDGLILSGEELVSTRKTVGSEMVLVTPGIRPMGTEIGDQKRVMTPAAAIAAGADHLVIGRPITAAPDPLAVAKAVLDEITSGL